MLTTFKDHITQGQVWWSHLMQSCVMSPSVWTWRP